MITKGSKVTYIRFNGEQVLGVVTDIWRDVLADCEMVVMRVTSRTNRTYRAGEYITTFLNNTSLLPR